MGDSCTVLSLPLLLRANQPYRFHIEHWPPGREEPQIKEVRFHFWPPVDADDTPPWTCSCGRPTGDNPDNFGHWELYVPITYEPPVAPWGDYA